MTWILSAHATTGNLPPEQGRAEEESLRDRAIELFKGLIDAGHTGLAATFHGEHIGDVNLLEPGATPAGAPENAPVEQQPGAAPVVLPNPADVPYGAEVASGAATPAPANQG